MQKWKKLNSKLIYTNPWLQLREDEVINPQGNKGVYSIIERKPSVFIVAVSDQNELSLIRMERYTTREEGWEIPAGGIFEGEDCITAAKRELREETGLLADELIVAGEFQTINSISNQVAYTVIAKKLNQSSTNLQKEEGIDRVKQVSIAELKEMI